MKALFVSILLFVSCNESPKTNTEQDTKEYPAKAVRIIEPFGAGGGPDIIARAISPKLSKLWGHTVIVENRTGNGATAAPEFVARSAADGYTLLINTSAQAYSAVFFKSLPYDPLKDFVPVAALTTQPYVLVTGKSSGIKTVAELIDAAKRSELKFGSTGVGTGTHIGLEKFNDAAKIKATHIPAQQGETIREVIENTMANRLTYILAPIQLALPDINDGDLIALGVTTEQRSTLLPATPTIDEAGTRGFDYPIWYGIWAPANTPGEVVDKIATDITGILETQEMRDTLAKDGASIMKMTRAQFEKFVLSESEMAAGIIKSTGFKK